MRARPISAIIGGLAVTVFVASACTSTGGNPSPATTSSTGAITSTSVASSSTGSDSSSVAPRVAHPLDASKMAATPCLALTATDLAGLQVMNPINGGANQTASGIQCTWTGSPGGSVGVAWETASISGLSDLYAKQSAIAYWQPTTVSGYPAAYGDAISDGRSQGDCVINVGVTDHMYFFVNFNNPVNAGASCTLAAQAATDVIRNLGGS